MRYTSLLITGALVLSVAAHAQTKKKPVAKKTTTTTKTKTTATGGFVKQADGLEYKIVTKGTGTALPKAGDVADMHVTFKMGDSVMMNTFVMNHGNPIQQQLQNPGMEGDVMGGILRMKAGDSTVFRMRMDTMFARTKQQKPEWAKGTYASWAVKLVDFKTREQVEAEAAGKVQAQAATDEQLILGHLKAKNITNAKRTASGLYYVIHNEGEGAAPQMGQKVTVNYTGINMDGEKFDSNEDPAFNHVSPFTFDLGKRGVIAGWDEGVALMKKGGKITLYIPSGLAYGPQARGPKIPANAILIFDIQLVSFE